jgi:hypothetical protein
MFLVEQNEGGRCDGADAPWAGTVALTQSHGSASQYTRWDALNMSNSRPLWLRAAPSRTHCCRSIRRIKAVTGDFACALPDRLEFAPSRSSFHRAHGFPTGAILASSR